MSLLYPVNSNNPVFILSQPWFLQWQRMCNANARFYLWPTNDPTFTQAICFGLSKLKAPESAMGR